MTDGSPIDDLVGRLRSARDDFSDALSSVAPESLTTPGLIGDWSARELIAHLGYWAGFATERIHDVELGGSGSGDLGGRTTDEVNETVARVARGADLATVRRREQAAFEALVERVERLDPALLQLELDDGGTLESAIRDDGHGHYAEHAAALRAQLTARADG